MTGQSEPKRAIDAYLAQRLHRALTAGGDELHGVLQDSAPEVLHAALKNRSLSEEHLLALLKRRDLNESLLKAIHQLEISRESHRLHLALVRNPGTPGPVVLSLLPHLHLFELVDLCYLTGVTPDQKFAAERAILKRLPTTELGNKLTIARRATAAVVDEIIRGGDPRLVEICLANPHLREVAVLQFLNGPTAVAETISMVGRHQKWQMHVNLTMAMLRNPRTPEIWFVRFLPGLRTTDIRNLLVSRRLTTRQKKLVEEELRRRGGG